MKMNQYAKMARDLHWPSVSPRKRHEMVQIKKSLRKSKRNVQISTNNVVYASFSKLKQGVPKYSYLEQISDEEPMYSRNNNSFLSRNRLGKSHYTQQLEQDEQKKNEKKQYKNYLDEFKRKRTLNASTHGTNSAEKFHPYYDWKAFKRDSNMDDASKVTLMKEKANMMQERSEQKEKLLSSKYADPEETSEVSNYLIGAIQAKIAILNTLHKEEL